MAEGRVGAGSKHQVCSPTHHMLADHEVQTRLVGAGVADAPGLVRDLGLIVMGLCVGRGHWGVYRSV